MTYDMYRGTKEDFEKGEGILNLCKITKTRLESSINQITGLTGKYLKEQIEKMINGELLEANGLVFWLEEAM